MDFPPVDNLGIKEAFGAHPGTCRPDVGAFDVVPKRPSEIPEGGHTLQAVTKIREAKCTGKTATAKDGEIVRTENIPTDKNNH